MKDILKKSDAEILEMARQLRVGYAMKHVLRYKTTRDASVHSESDAEHVFALIYLAEFFMQVEPAAANLDAAKLHRILLFHDFGEIKHGDVVTYNKTESDKVREREAAKEVFESLPKEFGKFGYAFWQEFEEQASSEARFAAVIDKIEPIFELLDAVNEQSMKRLKITYPMHISNKMPHVQNYPAIKRFVEVMSQDMNDRGVFAE